MYVCRWFVLCENVIHDRQTNNLTMVNALSVVRTPSFPALHVRFSFAAILDREGEVKGPLSLRFVRENDEGDEILLTATGDVPSPLVAQFYMNFPMGIRLFKEGKVTFRIDAQEGESEWYAVGSQSLQVELLKQTEESTPTEAKEPTIPESD
jgi:hypothetical protein